MLQALQFLVDLAKARGSQEQPLWHTDLDVAMAASSAGSYLINLLQLRVAHLSPLAITAPEAFLQACSRTSCSCPSSPSADPLPAVCVNSYLPWPSPLTSTSILTLPCDSLSRPAALLKQWGRHMEHASPASARILTLSLTLNMYRLCS